MFTRRKVETEGLDAIYQNELFTGFQIRLLRAICPETFCVECRNCLVAARYSAT